jgi:hypothetical protein
MTTRDCIECDTVRTGITGVARPARPYPHRRFEVANGTNQVGPAEVPLIHLDLLLAIKRHVRDT